MGPLNFGCVRSRQRPAERTLAAVEQCSKKNHALNFGCVRSETSLQPPSLVVGTARPSKARIQSLIACIIHRNCVQLVPCACLLACCQAHLIAAPPRAMAVTSHRRPVGPAAARRAAKRYGSVVVVHATSRALVLTKPREQTSNRTAGLQEVRQRLVGDDDSCGPVCTCVCVSTQIAVHPLDMFT